MKKKLLKAQKLHSSVDEQLKALMAEAMCCVSVWRQFSTMFLASQEDKFFATNAPIKGRMYHVVGYAEQPFVKSESSWAAHSH